MDKVTLKQCKEALAKLKSQITESISQAKKSLEDYESAEDLDDIDKSNNLNDISRLKKLIDQHSLRLTQVNSAEMRMSANKFGICLTCEEDIPKKRLLANPLSIRCIDCQEDLELSQKENKKRHAASGANSSESVESDDGE